MRSQDGLVLLLILTIVFCFLAFFWLAHAVAQDQTRPVDEWVIRACREPGQPAKPAGPFWLPGAMRDVTALGSTAVLVLALAAVAGLATLRRQYPAVWLLLGAMSGGLLLNYFLKRWIARPRPELALALVPVNDASFPSGHALLATVVCLTLGALAAGWAGPRKVKVYIWCVAGFVSCLVGVSRIYLGVHYPTDVLAGWLVGLLWAAVCWLVARSLPRRFP